MVSMPLNQTSACPSPQRIAAQAQQMSVKVCETCKHHTGFGFRDQELAWLGRTQVQAYASCDVHVVLETAACLAGEDGGAGTHALFPQGIAAQVQSHQAS